MESGKNVRELEDDVRVLNVEVELQGEVRRQEVDRERRRGQQEVDRVRGQYEREIQCGNVRISDLNHELALCQNQLRKAES